MKLLRHLTANEEQLECFPFRRELSMESYLVENEGVLALDNDTFSDVSIVQDELTLKQGRSSQDTDGRIDILLTYSNEYIGIVELKLGQLKARHLKQLEDYMVQKNQILDQYPDIFDANISPDPKWIGVLVGSSIDAGLAQKLAQGYTTTCGVQIAALTVQRFRGMNGGVYVTTDIHFKNTFSIRNTRKYQFNGQALGKGRLVLAIVKRYIEDNPDITFAELEKVFPNHLQGSSGVFSTYESACEVFEKSGRWRHFRKPEEIIELADATISVCSQWGIGNIDPFISKARKLGYSIKE